MSNANLIFCGYPEAYVFDTPSDGKKIKHLFWGDTLELRKGEKTNGFLPVYSRDVNGWIRESDTQKEQILDIIFLDVGQGDSIIIVTPNDYKILIDAGKSDNLYRYLKWRYKNLNDKTVETNVEGKIKTIILTHYDADHYEGLSKLIQENLFFECFKPEAIYHSGLFFTMSPKKTPQAKSEEVMRKAVRVDGGDYFDNIISTKAEFLAFVKKTPADQLTPYIKLLSNIINNPKGSDINLRMLYADSAEFRKQFPVTDGFSVNALSPILVDKQGKAYLTKFDGKIGIQKNGHSVMLKIQYKNVAILLPGDINEQSEQFLLNHYQGQAGTFLSDVYKVAHHGSSNVSDDFVKEIRPYAYVISSGDNEQYTHPRPDTIGLLGKVGRGDRPLVFCTELARSTAEYVKTPAGIKKEIKDAEAALKAAKKKDEKEALKKKIEELQKKANRSVSVYGAINLRTDGQRILFSQKYEKKANGKEWDIYRLEPGPAGFTFVK